MKSTLQNIILAFGLAALGGATVHAQGNGNPNPGILPPGAAFKGKTAGEWSAAWWQWVLGEPGNPQMSDSTGEFAHVNNNGADGVFFLAKTWVGTQERTIEIPTGTPLYVPLMGWGVTKEPGGFIEEFGSVENVFEQLFFPDILGVQNLSLEIDGEFVAALEDGNLHYLNFVENGDELIVPIWDANKSKWMEIAGYEFSVILTPLPPGEHTVRLRGEWSDGNDSFQSDVTYHLTVLPGRRK